MLRRLDAEIYTADETVTFRIPLTVPYYTDNKDYERVNGEFEHHGEFFKLVKQKLERDTLYIVCINDHKEKKIFNAMTDFVKLSNEMPASSKQTLKLLGTFNKDFFPASSLSPEAPDGWSLDLCFGSRQLDLLAIDFPVYSPPPDLIC
jgi:hypothetical protein